MASRAVCNERVLVLGSGDAAVAAVARLLWSPAPRLPHITLITGPAGLAGAADPYASPAPFAAARELTPFDLSRLPITAHVEVVEEDLARIKRRERAVVLAGGAQLRYERLLLLPELVEPTAGNLGLPSARALPQGVHAVGGGVDARGAAALDAAVAVLAATLAQQAGGGGAEEGGGGGAVAGGSLEGASRLLETSGEDFALDLLLLRSGSPPLDSALLPTPHSLRGCVLVYGDTLEAVAALAALLDRGVPGSSIVALLPPRGSSSSSEVVVTEEALAAALAPGSAPLTPAELHAGLVPAPPHTPAALFPAITLATLLRNAGVRTVPNALLTGAANVDRALTVALALGDRALSVRPALLLCCDTPQVPGAFFTAVNDCGIVFDGRLVVDEHFCATDAAVLGGGAAAKFTRRLRLPAPLSEYSAVETGGAVAASLLRSLGHSGHEQQQQQEQPPALPPPGLMRARTLRCALPGGFLYARSKVAAYEMGGSGRDACTHVVDA
jgi:hypothetical protein